MKQYVKTESENQISTIEFFHSQSNSLPSNILSELAHAITKEGKNKETRVIILKSGGNKAFCAGASFEELIAINNQYEGKEFFSGFANVINAARKCPKFIIGRVQGKAVGGGVGIVSATDYCFATKFASVKLSELSIGIGPFVVGPAVERKIGTSAFSSMTINANKWFNAEWAREKGLYSEVLETNESMDTKIKKLAYTLSESNPEAMCEIKKIMWKNTESWDKILLKRAECSGRLVLSDFTKNIIKKYKDQY